MGTKRDQELKARGSDVGTTSINPQDNNVVHEVGGEAAVTSGITQNDLLGDQASGAAEPFVYRCNCGWSGQLEHLVDGTKCANCGKQLAGDAEAKA